MSEYLKAGGLTNLKRSSIHQHLTSTLTDSKVPTLNQIGDILKKDFNLRYRKLDGALVHYSDPQFEEKRIWVSRLLSQFLTDDALVISVDECHIRSDKTK